MLTFENNNLRIEINQQRHLLYSIWLREFTFEEFKEANRTILQKLKEYHIEYWIVDSKVQTAIPYSHQQWILREIIPEIISSKLKRIAKIGSSDIFQFMSNANIAEQAKLNYMTDIEFEQFSSYNAALAWIELA